MEADLRAGKRPMAIVGTVDSAQAGVVAITLIDGEAGRQNCGMVAEVREGQQLPVDLGKIREALAQNPQARLNTDELRRAIESMPPDEYERATRVTYLGTVWGRWPRSAA